MGSRAFGSRVFGSGAVFSEASPTLPSWGYVTKPFASPRGHTLSFLGLWVYTALLIFQPVDFFPALSSLSRLPLVVAALTIVATFWSQMWIEGRLTAWTRELWLVVALTGFAIISIAWSTNTADSTTIFTDAFIKPVLMFFVMVNVIRTEKRLVGLLCLVLSAGTFLSWGALSAYRSGQFAVEGYRVVGSLRGSLSDPNDSALFLVMMLPIALALLLSSRQRVGQVFYSVSIALMLAAIFVTYSRGGFLALSCAGLFMAWKLFRRSPVRTASTVVLLLLVGGALLPSNYSSRLASIIDPDLDPHATSDVRRHLLERSIDIAAKNPVVGVGMGNFHLFSIHNQATHNAYTQVASEMGIPAMCVYLAFLLSPFGRLRRIERETRGISEVHSGYKRTHLLAVALQASLYGFMIGSFFLSVAYYWFIYYLIGYAVCLRRLYETVQGRVVGTYELKEHSYHAR